MSNLPQPKSHSRLIIIILIGFSLFAIAAMYYGMLKHHTVIDNVKIDGALLTIPQEINDFHLTDNTGKEFIKESLRGHWTLLFFGFTNCGMVCPTTMAELNKMYKTLQKTLPENKLPQVVMVSVDPDRDSVARMNSYVKSFNSHFLGVRGDMQATLALEKQLHIVSAKMQAEGQGSDHYTINHSAEIMLFNPQAQVQAFMSYPHKAEQMVKDYKLIIMLKNNKS